MKFLMFLSLLLASASVLADEASNAMTLSGFGSVGAVYNTWPAFGFSRELSQGGDAGKRYSAMPDTRIGVQLNETLNNQLELVAQILLRDQTKQNLDDVISRAFIAYRPLEGVRVRLGRMVDGPFLMSDYRDVGYAYPWVRPPESTYSMLVINDYDGADITYSLNDGLAFWRVKALVGKYDKKIPWADGKPIDFETQGLWGGMLMREQGPLRVWLGYAACRLSNNYVETLGLTQQLRDFASLPGNPNRAEALALAERFSWAGLHVGYTSVGLAYDDAKWMVHGELSELSSQTRALPKGHQAYLSIGRHFGDFLPYLLVGGMRSPPAAQAVGNWGGGAAASLQAQAVAFNNAFRIDQDVFSLGVRWDFEPRADFKLQASRMHVRQNGWGAWYAGAMEKANAGAMNFNILSAVVDFVF